MGEGSMHLDKEIEERVREQPVLALWFLGQEDGAFGVHQYFGTQMSIFAKTF
jgi:hypothetical protein